MESKGNKNNSLFKGPLLPLLILGMAAAFWIFNRSTPPRPLKYGELIQILQAAKENPNITVQNVRVGTSTITGEILTSDPISGVKDKTQATVNVKFQVRRLGLTNDPYIHELLNETVGANYQGEEEQSALQSITSILFFFLFLVAMGVALIFLMRWMSGGNSPFSFGRSRAKMYAQKDLPVTFEDVAGIDEAVDELREVVDFLKNPEKYQALGGRIPKGVLLVGQPGTGKTLLAKAVAGEAAAPFFSLSGSDFVEMFVGVGAARVRDLFGQAESRAPCIIFIDELDALGKQRAGNVVGSHDEREQTLNALLVEMDGFAPDRGVIIMGATNRPETLDQALLRPGRFDRTVVVDQPDVKGREAILKVHSRDVKLADDVDLGHVAQLTPGSVGADLANLINEAALIAARRGKQEVTMAEMNEAIERVAVGLERKSRIMRADEKTRVAYHEAGHALVTCDLPNTDPVHKISIIPRGAGVGGYVLSRPDDDRMLITYSQLINQIKICLGGTLAEEIVFDEISTGATSDLHKANTIARRMVTEFGMSPLGRVYFREGSGPQFLAPAAHDGERDHSEETAREIDMEVRKIIDKATHDVRSMLINRRNALEAIARRLVDKEVIEGAELTKLLEEFHISQEESTHQDDVSTNGPTNH